MDNDNDLNVNPINEEEIKNNSDVPPESAKNEVIGIMNKFVNIVGEDNAKKVEIEGLLVTDQDNIQQIINNVGNNIIDSIGGREIYEKIVERKIVFIDPDHV